MSTYQGTCGPCDASGCCSSPVLPSYTTQFSTSQTTDTRSAAVIYTETVRTIRAGGTPRFASHADYLKYKRAQALASGATRVLCRPPPSAAIRQIEATGCPIACEPVCPVGTTNDNTPQLAPLDLEFPDNEPFGFNYVQIQIDLIYGISTPLPEPPIGYPFTYGIILAYPPYCNSTNQTIHLFDSDGNNVSAQITDLGPFPNPPDFLVGFVIIYPSIDPASVTITLTASNSCSSSTGEALFFCFLAGSPIALADGTSKPIEQIVVGDRVIGAFGEINTVTGTLSNNLGLVPITNINGEHKTTAPHPHIAADHTFQCTDTLSLTKFAYGRKFPITGADGTRDTCIIKGVNPSRIKKLEVGAVLQTLTGPRTVTSLESIRMPPSTRVYHLTTDGSHSYTVDGYAVAGGATEEDFDYDTWNSRS
jgi:hypothetical protein